MELPLRLVCSECGHSVPWGEGRTGETPSACPICDGRVREASGAGEGGRSPSKTPSSLELTPVDFVPASWPGSTERPMPGTIGRFRIREYLGGGGFGQVYRAYDSRLERDVALKVLRDANPPPRVTERFFREARAAAQLDHPNIVPIHDAGRDEGRCWISYQYIAGSTLGRFRDEDEDNLRASVAIVRALADALDHAHRRGVFHRDVKPANVLVDAAGRPRLTDFGLARRVDFDPTMTQDGAILGTPAYMSPEQARGNSHMADARSDLYSLGVIFYELLCGRRPVEMPTGVPAWRAISNAPPKPPRSINRAIPRALDRACRRAVAHDPADRYPDARAFSDDLERWLNGTGSVRRFLRIGLLAGSLVAAVVAREVIALAARPFRPAPAVEAPKDVAGPTPRPHRVVAKPAPPPVPVPETLIGNSSSMTVHLDDCSAVSQMSGLRRTSFAGLDAALARGYKPCRTCLKRAAASIGRDRVKP